MPEPADMPQVQGISFRKIKKKVRNFAKKVKERADRIQKVVKDVSAIAGILGTGAVAAG